VEQATLPHPAATATPAGFPPGTRLPAIAQVALYARDPLGFLIRFQRRYGDVFTVRFPFFERLVYVADPALVKEVFTGSPEQLHAGEANATVLEPALGPSSVLTLDEAPHMRQRKLLLPPFHGERIQRYGELIREVTLKEMESWPVGEPFALRPHTQRITLAVIMRAVFGVHDEERLARFGRLDALVNNAAIFQRPAVTRGPFEQITVEEWDRVMAVNVKGIWNCVRAVVPVMRTQGGGRIVNVASAIVAKGTAFLLHYVTSKGAVVAMTRALARELGPDNIAVNAVAPGLILSDTLLENPDIMAFQVSAIMQARSLRRDAYPEDVEGTVVFLASDDSSFMSGQTLVVDGGSVFSTL